ncbi:hypothetical protein NEF87_001808 [Candidatus Lokiarchaeum ossiferum]|uniref:Uncharacterized protein n=1 Tax=Candidatus Lokiarchaeum ossiferum TaxID=2951803 RepID=A0ABY6HPS8_9ARCH|nr:hypothetical protein NEF87_001808 [Candidatus Lokiarchaeum sp. B-35]
MSEKTHFKIDKVGKKPTSERGYRLEDTIDGNSEPERKNFARLMEHHGCENEGPLWSRKVPFTK